MAKELPENSTSTREKLIVFVLVVVVTSMPFAIIWWQVSPQLKPLDCKAKVVEAIGACNDAGVCAVRFEDGTYNEWRLPIVGGKVLICRRR